MSHWYEISSSGERKEEYSFVYKHLGLTRRILDIGCTGSPLVVNLAEAGFEVYGVDCRPYRNSAGGIPAPHVRFHFTEGNATNLPFPEKFFDIVLAISTIEHIGLGSYGDSIDDEGDKKTVNEVRRVLIPGGWFILSVPYGNYQIRPGERCYDEKTLTGLVSEFRKLDSKYLRFVPPYSKGNRWEQVPKEDLVGLGDSSRYLGVACLLLEKIRP